MNPNHPHYAGLGGGPNLNLLDNMLMAAGFQVSFILYLRHCVTRGSGYLYRWVPLLLIRNYCFVSGSDLSEKFMAIFPGFRILIHFKRIRI